MSDMGNYIPLVESEVGYIDFFLCSGLDGMCLLYPPQKERPQRQNIAFTAAG